jgi:queuine tRNA-ribosyltransferase
MSSFLFSVQAESDSGFGTTARAGIFETPHGRTETPVFMPVGTNAIVRGHHTDTLGELGFSVLLANTYHLLLRPTPAVFEHYGGIHNFMRWDRSILTDSGGFQVFSLAKHTKMSEEGVCFRSYVDGSHLLLSPEVSIAAQRSIGSDIMMVLDQCVSALAGREEAKAALERTFAWAKRSLRARGDSRQALFGIIQGASYLDLRRQSAEQITSLEFDGYAIGGVAVGDDRDRRDEVIAFTSALLPADKPRYLMGVGTPPDLLEAVARGMDMFDCILPTALAQQGVGFTPSGRVDLKKGIFKLDRSPIEEGCACSTCARYSRGYLHHLIKAGETMGGTLIGIHNLSYYARLTAAMRSSIFGGNFAAFYRQTKEGWRHFDDAREAGRLALVPPRKKREVLGDYELTRRESYHSVRHVPSGEVMHCASDPLDEAASLYVDQSGLRDRLLENPESEVVLWDVGLGAAANAMASIFLHEKLSESGEPCRLTIASFENDLNPLKLARGLPSLFRQVRHPAVASLLDTSAWRSKNDLISWTLYFGDFLDRLEEAPMPDIVFFDPFSYKTNATLWTAGAFARLYARCRSGTIVLTYSSSTAVRTAMLAAGFWIAAGISTGAKTETTVALVPGGGAEDRYRLLGPEWLERWERSQSQLPPGASADEAGRFREAVTDHPQFKEHRRNRSRV